MYAAHLVIPANTGIDAPASYELEVAPCVIRSVDVVIPGGCVDLVSVWIEYRSARLFPTNDDGYFMGNDTHIHFEPNREIVDPPLMIVIKGINGDEKYAHSPSLYFGVEFYITANLSPNNLSLIQMVASLNTRRLS